MFIFLGMVGGCVLYYVTPFNKKNNFLPTVSLIITLIELVSYLATALINPGIVTANNPTIDDTELKKD